MKKIIIAVLILSSWTPYLFLATSVNTIEMSERSYNCTVKSMGLVNQTIGFGSVYYDPMGLHIPHNKNIVLPYFFQHGEVMYGQCSDIQIFLGVKDDWLKSGNKLHVVTKIEVIKFFGIEIARNRSWVQMGSGWNGKKEGEVVTIKLVNDKEVKMFGGKVLK